MLDYVINEEHFYTFIVLNLITFIKHGKKNCKIINLNATTIDSKSMPI